MIRSEGAVQRGGSHQLGVIETQQTGVTLDSFFGSFFPRRGGGRGLVVGALSWDPS